MPRGLQVLLALGALAVVAAMGRLAIRIQRERDAASRGNPYEAMRADAHLKAPGGPAVVRAPAEEPPGLRAPPAVPVAWTEVPPSETGIDFVHTFGGGAMDNLVKASCGGVTLFDADGDGDLDIYFVQGAYDPVAAPASRGQAGPEPPVNRLYRNDGGWRFTDATAASGLGDPGFGMGAAAADYDGDGDLDLALANFGRCRLFRNEGGGRFADVSDAAGIDASGFFVGACWGDADGDGNLDLLLCGYLRWDPAVPPIGNAPFAGPLQFPGEPPRLYLGRPDGTFRDATREAGLLTSAGRGMGAAFADLDGDGRQEILVANDAVPNFAFERRDDSRWVETAYPLGLALSALGQARSSMGIAVFDADRDGRPDLAVPDGSGGTLYRNLGGRFEDVAGSAGLDGAMRGRVGWSGTPLDFDLDGWPDLLLTCGALQVQAPQRTLLFRNGGGLRFEDAAPGTALGREAVGRGAAAGDLDGDGDPDIVMVNLGARPLLFRNGGVPGRRSLLVRCVARGRNRGALGAVVEVHAGGLVQREEVRTTQGYLSGSGPDLLFGLGERERADRVVVRFPSGEVRTVASPPAGLLEVRE
jgi:hypothetical protein